jgi:ubiquinone/menaquinone biosynthesis C-methylase UbiE
LLRQGPGDNPYTRQAFHAVGCLGDNARIADIGCGPGMQTLELARLTGHQITAVDIYRPFLLELQFHAMQEGMAGQIETAVCDMAHLPFGEGTIDLFWCEGAIYIIGFANGLKAWRPMLGEGGVIAVTEVAWLKGNIPDSLSQFWQAEYPAITTVNDNLSIANGCGYEIISHFILPSEAWWTHYYRPIEQRLPELRLKYQDNPEAMSILDCEYDEIEMFRKYHEYYGYVFFILKRR